MKIQNILYMVPKRVKIYFTQNHLYPEAGTDAHNSFSSQYLRPAACPQGGLRPAACPQGGLRPAACPRGPSPLKSQSIKYLMTLTTLLFLCLLTVTVYAQPSAKVDRNTVYLGESFQLTIHAGEDGSEEQPDVSGLQNEFDILSSGQSSQVLISNGKSFTDTLWLFVLSPRHSGAITIPAIPVGNQKTQPIKINVKAADPNNPNQPSIHPDQRHVFMSSRVVPGTPYVQSQALYKVTIYYDRNIENPKLSEPHATGVNFIHLGNDRNYQKTIKGKKYQIYEVNFAMFPQKSGKIKISSPIFVGNVMNQAPGKYFSNMWQPFRISASDITVDVKPIPSKANSNWWLPAKNVSVKDDWSQSPSKFEVGTPITRTITIKAEEVMANQLPQVMPTQLDNFQIYQDKAKTDTTTDGKHIYASRIEKAAFIANTPGEYTIPEIKVHWWNTDTNQEQVTTVPARKVKVVAGSGAPMQVKTPAKALAAPINIEEKPGKAISTEPEKVVVEKPKSLWKDPWFWLANGFILIWVLTIIVLWQKSKAKKQPKINPEQLHLERLTRIRHARSAVKNAAKENDVVKFKDALIAFANCTWPHHQCLSIGDIIDRMEDETATDALSEFDAYLYNDDQDSIDLSSLWKRIEKGFILKKDKSDDDILPKMY